MTLAYISSQTVQRVEDSTFSLSSKLGPVIVTLKNSGKNVKERRANFNFIF